MPRYVVERTFAECPAARAGLEVAELCTAIVERNADDGVTWLHSYVSQDESKSFCVYDTPSPEAIRKTTPAQRPSPRPDHAGTRPRPALLPLGERRGT
jgi:Nickel responsive protein SCO4226-like